MADQDAQIIDLAEVRAARRPPQREENDITLAAMAIGMWFGVPIAAWSAIAWAAWRMWRL